LCCPPTNERANVLSIVGALAYLREHWDLSFCSLGDDSTSGTAVLVRRLAHDDSAMRLVLQLGRNSLAGAIYKEGLLNASGDWLVVMDCDGQHEPTTREPSAGGPDGGRASA